MPTTNDGRRAVVCFFLAFVCSAARSNDHCHPFSSLPATDLPSCTSVYLSSGLTSRVTYSFTRESPCPIHFISPLLPPFSSMFFELSHPESPFFSLHTLSYLNPLCPVAMPVFLPFTLSLTILTLNDYIEVFLNCVIPRGSACRNAKDSNSPVNFVSRSDVKVLRVSVRSWVLILLSD